MSSQIQTQNQVESQIELDNLSDFSTNSSYTGPTLNNQSRSENRSKNQSQEFNNEGCNQNDINFDQYQEKSLENMQQIISRQLNGKFDHAPLYLQDQQNESQNIYQEPINNERKREGSIEEKLRTMLNAQFNHEKETKKLENSYEFRYSNSGSNFNPNQNQNFYQNKNNYNHVSYTVPNSNFNSPQRINNQQRSNQYQQRNINQTNQQNQPYQNNNYYNSNYARSQQHQQQIDQQTFSYQQINQGNQQTLNQNSGGFVGSFRGIMNINLKVLLFKADGISGKIVAIYDLLEKQQPDVLVITETQFSQNSDIQFIGYSTYRTMSSKMSGVMILVKYGLKSHVVEMYKDSSLTIEIDIENNNQGLKESPYKLYILGVNLNIDEEWKSVKSLVKNLLDIYQNPGLIACGNFNKYYFQMNRLKEKYNLEVADTLTEEECEFKIKDEYNAVFTKENVKELKKTNIPIIYKDLYKIEIQIDLSKRQKYLGSREFFSKKRVSQFIQRIPGFSITRDASQMIQRNVYKTTAFTQIFRPQNMFNMPYSREWFQKRTQFKENIWNLKLQKIDKVLKFKNIDENKFYNKIQKAIKHGAFCENALATLEGKGLEAFAVYYGEYFKDININIPKIQDSRCLPDQILLDFIQRGLQNFKTGQGLSRDFVPDDCFSKQQLQEKIYYERDIIFNSSERPQIGDRAKALIISKNNKKIVEPKDTYLVVIQPLVIRIIDAVCLQITKDLLWDQIGEYQKGFRGGSSSLKISTNLLREIQITCNNDQIQEEYQLFVRFVRPFDQADRSKLIEILKERIRNPAIFNIIQKLIVPQIIEIDEQNYFIQEKGITNGLQLGPLLFATYLDYFLKQKSLTDIKMKAYGYQLVFTVNSIEMLENTIKSISELQPYLEFNKEKSGILQVKGSQLQTGQIIQDVKVQNNYKFLGSFISPYKYLIIEKSVEAIQLYQYNLSTQIRKLQTNESLSIIQSFILGELLIKLLPVYLVGNIKLEQVQSIYRETLEKSLIQLKISDENQKFENHSIQRFNYIMKNFKPKIDYNTLNDDKEVQLILQLLSHFGLNNISEDYGKIINLQTSIWIFNDQCCRCLLHNEPLGKNHMCDQALLCARVPLQIRDIFEMSEINAALLAEKVYTRLKEIGKFEYYRVNNNQEELIKIMIEVIEVQNRKRFREKKKNQNQNKNYLVQSISTFIDSMKTL
eukprot:403360915